MIKGKENQSGQIGVIILLMMVVLLTIGLSLASRSTQDLFLATQQAESTRVFNAAEAGIEEALSTALDFEGATLEGSVGTIEDANVNYVIRKVNELETRLFEGVAVMVDVTGVSDGQQLVFDWSKTTTDPASLVAVVYYDDAGTTRVRHYGLGGSNQGDGFTLASTGDFGGYTRRSTLTLQSGDLFVRVWPIYNDTYIKVTGNGWTLPVQYYNVRSEAQNENGNETRIVEVNRTLSTAPSVMDYAVFSGTTLTK
ncbi:MAG TPA: pilus assembly PilX N-terminal domain-containing protein [Patescibacteria group bacterium]